MSYRLECQWKTHGDQLRAEVVAFWLAEGAIKDPEQAAMRAQNLMVIARDEGGRLAAVSTAYRETLHNFGFSMFLFQMFIGKKYRHLGLAQSILIRAWKELGRRFAEGESRDTLGLIVEVNNPKAMRVRNETVWRDQGMEMVYIGKSPRGFHMRAWYFEGARVPI